MGIDFGSLLGILDERGSVTVNVQGSSMSPFLHDKTDFVVLEKPRNIRRGDIVVFEKDGYFIMHRVVSIGEKSFTALGDNLTAPERDVPVENIRAKVVSACRGGKRITPSSPVWRSAAIVYGTPFLKKAAAKILRRKR